MSEAQLSALIVALLTGGMLTVLLAPSLGLSGALTFTVPGALALGAVLGVLASIDFKLGGKKPPKEE